MTDLLEREGQLYDGGFGRLPLAWEELAPVEQKAEMYPIEIVLGEVEEVQPIPGQEDLLVETYRPIRELGGRGIVHMVKVYAHDVNHQEWPKLDR